MALVNDKPKFIFFHLYKCGGMSLRKLFDTAFPDTYELQGGHGLPSDLKEHFEKNLSLEKFNEYFKFTIIRNPFDFMVSTFFYAKSYTNHFMHEEVVGRNMTMLEFIPYYFNVRIAHTKEEVRPFGSNKVVTFKDWLHDKKGNEIMDSIIKLEQINEVLPVILKKLGVPQETFPQKNINPNRVKGYREYYTPESRAMIEKYFAWELKIFNYEF